VKSSRLHRFALPGLMIMMLSGCAQLEQLLDTPEPRRSSARVEEKSRAHSDRADRDRGERAEKAERPLRQERPVPVRDEAALREGIRLYNEGDYNAAIKRLNSSDMNGASPRNRLAALKYTAFSYCVTGRQAQCRQTFERALKLDPDFDLAQGEHGHPLWGPVFVQARQAANR
jgi:tetratricopeptide (TPR) repeat protein